MSTLNSSMRIGSYRPSSDGSAAIIERGVSAQGCIFKDEGAYLSGLDAVCYVPELDDTAYTRRDFLAIAGGNMALADLAFDSVDWQHPETWLDEQIINGDVVECDHCKWMFLIPDTSPGIAVACPRCRSVVRDEY